MKWTLSLLIVIATGALVAAGWLQSGGLALHAQRAAGTPEEAVRGLMADIQARNWDRAYASLDHANDVPESDFIREVAGTDGSLRTYSTLQSFEVWPLHRDANQATLRVRMNWSSAVGSLDELRDLTVNHDHAVWKVVWPKPNFPNVPQQVLPVNYLRWD